MSNAVLKHRGFGTPRDSLREVKGTGEGGEHRLGKEK